MFGEDLDNIDENSIIVCDPIKNSIIQHSNFYKTLYSNDLISFNGIYVKFNLINTMKVKEKITFNINAKENEETISKLSKLENSILDIINCNLNKNKINKISEFLNNGYIKYNYNDVYLETEENTSLINENYTKKTLFLKISGLWETRENIGLTFKIFLVDRFIDFYPSVEKKDNKI